MELMRDNWTDERLDDLNSRVDAGFARVDKDIRELRLDMNARFESMEGRFEERAAEGGLPVVAAPLA